MPMNPQNQCACLGWCVRRNLPGRAHRLLPQKQERASHGPWETIRSRFKWGLVEGRRHPRYQLETDIRIYPRNSTVVRGHTVDISESGISAMLPVEVAFGEVVRLEMSLPAGDVEVHALVRQWSAFRYGFQFVETSSAQEVIGRTCRQLAVEQAIFNPLSR